jgi:quinol monooxygenase YgiN
MLKSAGAGAYDSRNRRSTQFNNPRSFILMATTSLGIHYFIKDGHRDTVLSKLKGVIELCTKEPEFINAIISETSERPNQLFLHELWRGTRADFDAVQGVKPYRKAYLADVKQYLEKVDVVWSSAIVELGSHLTDLNSN